MAGSQDPNENPVAINVVPMVDIIFCLCVFFMCSLKFKELEGKFDSWLPKDKGSTAALPDDAIIEEIRVAILWDEQKEAPVRRMGNREVPENDELERLIKEAHEDHVRLNKPDTPVIIDADERVPWNEVVVVLNLAKRNNIEKIEFALGKKR